jgi:hypothetical protein
MSAKAESEAMMAVRLIKDYTIGVNTLHGCLALKNLTIKSIFTFSMTAFKTWVNSKTDRRIFNIKVNASC